LKDFLTASFKIRFQIIVFDKFYGFFEGGYSGIIICIRCSTKVIGVVAAIAFRQPNIVQKLNSSTAVEPIFVSRYNANAMLAEALLSVEADKLCFE
jgi:hypothetical protein